MSSGFVVAAAVMVLVAARADAQPAADAAPHFEVASIKPGLSPADAGRAAAASGGTFTFPFVGVRVQPGGRLIANTTLQGLILRAYGIESYQVEGGPAWSTTDYFEIAAKAERETATDEVDPAVDRTDPEDRDNDQLTGSVSYFGSRPGLGTHDVKAGVEVFSLVLRGGNSQSSTGYLFNTDYASVAGRPLTDSTGRVVPDAFTHGSSAQRVRWFKRGYQTGDLNQCDTFNADEL